MKEIEKVITQMRKSHPNITDEEIEELHIALWKVIYEAKDESYQEGYYEGRNDIMDSFGYSEWD